MTCAMKIGANLRGFRLQRRIAPKGQVASGVPLRSVETASSTVVTCGAFVQSWKIVCTIKAMDLRTSGHRENRSPAQASESGYHRYPRGDVYCDQAPPSSVIRGGAKTLSTQSFGARSRGVLERAKQCECCGVRAQQRSHGDRANLRHARMADANVHRVKHIISSYHCASDMAGDLASLGQIRH
jgi:hypothetical protein